jgi:DNA-binding response OmpR family regulator
MLKIMVIDQDIRQIREIRDELVNRYVLLNCSKGSKAFDLFRIFQPNAVIMDPVTTGLNTQAFIAGVRGLPNGVGTPILFLTQFTTIRNIENQFDWGADFIFSKPCPADRLKDKLAEYLFKSLEFPNTQLVQL